MKGIYTASAFTTESGVELAPGAIITVRKEVDNNLATLYADPDGLVLLGNPFAADDEGFFSFHTDGEELGFKIAAASGGETHTLRYQPIGNLRYLDMEDLEAAFQSLNATLTSIAALTMTDDKGIYFGGSPLGAALFDLSAIARQLLDDASFSEMRQTLGVRPGVEVQSYNSVLDSPVGRQTMWIPAAAMSPRVNNGCALLSVTTGASNQPDVPYLSFSDEGSPQARQSAGFVVRMPKSWNEGAITAAFCFRRASGSSAANVVWGIRAVAIGDNESPALNFGADATVTAACSTTAANFKISAETGSCQIGTGSPPAAESLVFFEVFRDGASSSDSLDNVAALLSGVTLYFTNNALTDA